MAQTVAEEILEVGVETKEIVEEQAPNIIGDEAHVREEGMLVLAPRSFTAAFCARPVATVSVRIVRAAEAPAAVGEVTATGYGAAWARPGGAGAGGHEGNRCVRAREKTETAMVESPSEWP